MASGASARSLSLAAAVALILGLSRGAAAADVRRPTGPAPGGFYRTAVKDFGFTDEFDPTGEYSYLGWQLDSELLVRTLLTYRHVAGQPGAEVVPDLATDLGQVSQDGLTYTFHLKPGIRFGPPVSRPILSSDVEYAFE